jgi:glycosyltransferase involved in cell wall biosynthesis
VISIPHTKSRAVSSRSVPDGLVMVCDVDLSVPDATRVHTVEVARGFAAEGLAVDLVARGPDPGLDGVAFWRGRGTDSQRITRVLTLNLHVLRLLWGRRRVARRLYIRYRWSLLPVLIAGWLLRYRIVTQVDDIPFGAGYQFEISPVADHVQRFATVLMSRLARGIVAVTPEIKRLLVDQFRAPARRIAVLPNGVDIEFFTPQPRAQAIARLGLDPDRRYVVFCGHFAPWVDFDTIAGAFAIVARARPDARLLLVGEGSERPRLEHMLEAGGASEAAIFTGYVSDRSRVRDYVAAATVALSANRYDYRARIGVSPVKLAEYMAAARAVVATELPGLRETLADTGAGRVVPIDPGAMAEAIISLLDPDCADELGARGRRLAVESFSWRSIVARTIPLFGISRS